MSTLKIRNWEKWQSYRKDRGQPPWIKLHREVMRNPEWVSLTDAQRGQLVGMWLLAADHNGVIPASPLVIRKLCHLDTSPDLESFINLGFIEQDANAASAWRQHDATDTDTEAETETDTEAKKYIVDTEKKPSVSTTQKSKKPKTNFIKPTIEEVTNYCRERKNAVNPSQWFDHYSANGWKVGKNPMRDWKAAIRTWERSNGGNHANHNTQPKAGQFLDALKRFATESDSSDVVREVSGNVRR